MDRITWYEDRKMIDSNPERFLIIAERFSEGWRFYERSIWDICWYETPLTPELVRKAERKIKK